MWKFCIFPHTLRFPFSKVQKPNNHIYRAQSAHTHAIQKAVVMSNRVRGSYRSIAKHCRPHRVQQVHCQPRYARRARSSLSFRNPAAAAARSRKIKQDATATAPKKDAATVSLLLFILLTWKREETSSEMQREEATSSAAAAAGSYQARELSLARTRVCRGFLSAHAPTGAYCWGIERPSGRRKRRTPPYIAHKSSETGTVNKDFVKDRARVCGCVRAVTV